MIDIKFIEAVRDKILDDGILSPQNITPLYMEVNSKDGVIGGKKCHYEISWEPRQIARQQEGYVYVCFHCEDRSITKKLEADISPYTKGFIRLGWKKCFALRLNEDGVDPTMMSCEEFVTSIVEELYQMHSLLDEPVRHSLGLNTDSTPSIRVNSLSTKNKIAKGIFTSHTELSLNSPGLTNEDYNVFISYSRKDSNLASEIKETLEKEGIKVWIDIHGIYSGDEFKQKIVSAIRNADIFMFLSSEHSNSSEWTIKEVNVAVDLKKTIIPVKLDDTPYADSIMFDLAGKDFTNISMPNAFDRLIASCKEKLNI